MVRAIVRAARRRRPLRRQRLQALVGVDLTSIADLVRYEPSAEHKDYLTPAGLPRLRTDATPCPRGVDLDEVVVWLRGAVRRGDVSAAFENEFPRYVWTRVGESCYEARLTNADQGTYKGYPLTESECPSWLN